MKTFMCLFAILLFSLCCVAIGAAQESDEQTILPSDSLSITGTVTDEEGNPLPGVRVATMVGEEACIAITDFNGEFTLSNLPPGTYDLNLHSGDINKRYEDKTLNSIEAGSSILTIQLVTKRKLIQVSKETIREWGLTYDDVPPEQDAGVNYQRAVALYVPMEDYVYFPQGEDNDEIERLQYLRNYVSNYKWVKEAEELVPWLKANLTALEEFREGAKKKGCNMAMYYEEGHTPKPWSTLMPDLACMPGVVSFTLCYTSYQMSEGKYKDAINVLLDNLRAGQQMRGGKFLIESLIGNLIQAITFDKLRNIILTGNDMPNEVLIYLNNELSSIIAENPTLANVFKNERIAQITVLEDYYRGDEELMDQVGLPHLGDNPYPKEKAISDLNEFFDVADEIVSLPLNKAFIRWKELEKYYYDIKEKLSTAAIVLGVLANGSDIEYFAFADVRLKVLLIMSALERYKREKGAYPVSLAELVPEYMDSVPIDAFDGQELRYRLEGQNYLLWSVAPDLKDNDGAIKDKEKGWPMRWENYDYVFTNVLEKPEPFQLPKPESEPTDEANEGQ